ncbi:MAG TPA: TonB-dependent receptor [Anseongella sp.]
MRLATFFIIIGCMHVSATAWPQTANSTMSVSLKKVPLEEALTTIAEKSGYHLLYNDEKLANTDDHVSIKIRRGTISEIMKACLKGLPLSYRIVNKTIIITPKAFPASAPEIRKPIIVAGIVTDSTGAPLPGVAVFDKTNKSIGTSTDQDGRYVLEIDENSTLIFSMIGFIDQEVSVSGRTIINIELEVSADELDEIVITAFGNKEKRSDMVGSVASISASDLAKNPSSNLTTALAGRAAGIIAFQRSGEPGEDNADFFIRGVTTFGTGKVDPLILIDGIELTPTDLARVQPNDIASFTILKDATATAVYGARGANGVILVTTKEGTDGKARLSVQIENSISGPTRNIELADPVTYMQLYNEAVKTRDPLGALLYSQEKIVKTAEGSDPIVYPATDWRAMLFKDYASTKRVNVNVSGGGNVAKYFVSGSYNRDNGLLKVDPRNNFNSNIKLSSYKLRSNININLTPGTRLTVRLNGTFDDYTGPIQGGAATYEQVMHSNPVLFPAYFPIDSAHRFTRHILFGNYQSPENNSLYNNPYAEMVKGYRDYSRALMLAQVELRQNLNFLTEGLTFKTMVNTYRKSYFSVTRAYDPYFYQINHYDQLTGAYAINALNAETAAEYLDYNKSPNEISTSFYLEAILNYNRRFNEKHGVGAMMVYQMKQNLDAQGADLQQSLPFRNLGVSGKATYDYDRRYYAEFAFGYNGSERFASNHRFGFFPSFGLAWSISNERFFEPLKQSVTNLRLRATYGLIGNDAIGEASDRFFYLSNINMNAANRSATFGNGSSSYFSLRGVDITRYSNYDITWETATKKNIALELGLFDRWSLNIEVYSQIRKNILMDRASIPVTMGLTAPIRANVGEASGTGTDISLDYKQTFMNGFWLTAMGNFTYATSEYRVYEEPNYDEPWRYRVGNPISQPIGYIAERLFIDDEEALNAPPQNFGTYGGGDIKYLDVNRDGQITQADQVPIGTPAVPEIVYGFGISLGYKSVDFSVFFQGLSNESFRIDAGTTWPFANQNALLKVYADDHWSEDNRNINALFPRLSPTVNENNTRESTWWRRDGTFLRLKQAEIGFSLPEHLLEKIRANSVRIYINGSNLLTFSKFKLWDVEMGGQGLGYPIQRVFNIGLNMNL